MTNKILNQSQAQAVYSAMCHLNKVGAASPRFNFPSKPGKRVAVEQRNDGRVVVTVFCVNQKDDEREDYASQSYFATAYGLQTWG